METRDSARYLESRAVIIMLVRFPYSTVFLGYYIICMAFPSTAEGSVVWLFPLLQRAQLYGFSLYCRGLSCMAFPSTVEGSVVWLFPLL